MDSVPLSASNTTSNLASKVLLKDFDKNAIKKIPIDLTSLNLKHSPSKNAAFALENVFTHSECTSLIELAESKGFSKALVNIGGTDILNEDLRSGSRFILDDEEFTSVLWERIFNFIPERLKGAKVKGLNERLRFLRYHPGESFAPHSDGTYARKDNPLEVSLITLQIYLNEGFQGGETTFLGDEENVYEGPRIPIVPKAGMILVFDQDLMHEGSLLKSGVKYTVRTDVMFSYS